MSLPTPYYQDESCTIYHGNCHDFLEDLPPVDLVLTDPPYGIGYVHGAENIPNATKFQGVPVLGDNQPFDPEPWLQWPCILWGANHYAKHLPGAGRWLVWDKRAGTKTYGKDMSDLEMAWVSGPRRADRIFWHLWDGFLKDSEKGCERFHPTQKPIQVMEWCLGFSEGARVILDPFMGSGTSLVACKNLGLRAIGIEIEEKYCEIAVRRLAQTVLPL